MKHTEPTQTDNEVFLTAGEIENRDTPRGSKVTDTNSELACVRIIRLIAEAEADTSLSDDERQERLVSLGGDFELIKAYIDKTADKHNLSPYSNAMQSYAKAERWYLSDINPDELDTRTVRDVEERWRRGVQSETGARDRTMQTEQELLSIEIILAEAKSLSEAEIARMNDRIGALESARELLRLGDSSMLEASE